MKLTCTRHAGRVPTGPRTHLPQPTCSWRCAWQSLCTNPVLPGKRCGTAVRNQGTRAQPNPNRWPGQRNGPVDRGSDSSPAQRRRRPRPKSGRGRRHNLKSASFGQQQKTLVGSARLIGPRPRGRDDNEEAKDLVWGRKIRVVRQCPGSPPADRPRSRCVCPGQCSPVRPGRCRTT